MSIRELKLMPKEEFLKLSGMTEEIYEALHKAKEGFIHVVRERDKMPQKGYTYAFGEGISCRMDNLSTWWCTSVIQKINWEEGYFDTLNSRYYFEFKESKKNEENNGK